MTQVATQMSQNKIVIMPRWVAFLNLEVVKYGDLAGLTEHGMIQYEKEHPFPKDGYISFNTLLEYCLKGKKKEMTFEHWADIRTMNWIEKMFNALLKFSPSEKEEKKDE